jgi:hypothetical protein
VRESPTHDPVDDLIRSALPGRVPTDAELDQIEVGYRRRISLRVSRRVQIGRHPSLLVAFLVGITVAGLLFAQIARPAPASASLTEVAETVRAAGELDPPAQNLVYTRTESLRTIIRYDETGPFVFQVDAVSEFWWGNDPRLIHIRSTMSEPLFFDAEAELRFNRGSAPGVPGMGVTETRTILEVNSLLGDLDWPTDPVALDVVLREASSDGTDEQVFRSAISMLTEPLIAAELRAAAIEVLANLGVDITHRSPDTISFEIMFDGGPAIQRDRVTLSKDGHPISLETVWPHGSSTYGVPPGAVMTRIDFGPKLLVPAGDAP